MPKPTLDADTILKRAAPVAGQHAHEIQPFGHLVECRLLCRNTRAKRASTI
jgi:hypothetical protein